MFGRRGEVSECQSIRYTRVHSMRPPVILYVGAGIDLPLSYIPSTHRLVCVDSQPFSEFGIMRCDCHEDTNCFSRPRFLAQLDMCAWRNGLIATADAGHNVRKYGDRVRYYTNTSIPEHLDRLRGESPFSTLLVRGHHPHESVMNLLCSNDNTFMGFLDTVYHDDEEESVIRLLNTCECTRARFRMFTLVEDDTMRMHCTNWFDFVRHTQRGRSGS